MEKTRREGTAVLAGVEVKGRLMFGILITPRATDPARLAEGDWGLRQRLLIKWLQRPFPRGYSSAFCAGRHLARDLQSDSGVTKFTSPFVI